MVESTHPKALWWLSLVYSLYAISYGVLFSNLLIFSDQVSYLGFTENYAFQFFASFSTLTFILPLIGGFLCDRFGFLRVAKLGLFLAILGMLMLAMPLKSAFYIGIALCLSGNAFAMPAIWSMVGMIYKKGHDYREAGTTLFYLLFNIGFLISFSLSSLVAKVYGFPFMYILFALGALFAFLVLIIIGKTIPGLIKIKSNMVYLLLYTIGVFFLTLILLYFLMFNNIVIWLFTLGIFVYLIFLLKQTKNKKYMYSIKAFIFLCFLGIVGITIYNSEFGLLPEFAQHAVDLHIGAGLLPAQMITTLDPLFCIVLGFIFSRLWVMLANKNRNPLLATKLSLGIIIPALGYLLLVLGIYFNLNGKLALIWLLPVFILFVSGELLVMPIGIAMASKLAPPGKEGLFMGIWNVMQGFSALLTGYLAYFTVVNTHQTQHSINVQYLRVFLNSGLIILIIGIVAFFTRRFINRLLRH